MAGNSAKAHRSVVSRVLGLFGAFDDEHRILKLSDLARRANVSVPSAHRLVNELVDGGLLERFPNKRYGIGRDLWTLGMLAPLETGLRQAASPFLNDLHGGTHATVHLAVRDGGQALYIDRLSGHASVPVVSHIGSRLPLHATGVGKVLLAYAPEPVQTEVLKNLTRVTRYTVTQPGRMLDQIKRVHSEGYATTSEEMSLGACSVAVPVSDRDGEVTAALGIVVPTFKNDVPRLVAMLQTSARGISRSL